jgi:2-succinyl-6-hydroxy-2,4-cyclohexadiene-1-carboxylate synthase
MTPLILLHGFSGSPASWEVVVAKLPSSVRIVRPTIGGHVEVPPPASFEGEVDRLAGIVREGGAAGAHLCGYSLGGRLATGLLVRHRELFSGATLIGANFGLSSEEERRARRAQDEEWASLLEREGTAGFIARWEAQPLFASQEAASPEARAAQQAQRLRHDPNSLAGAMRALGLAEMPNYEEGLGSVDLPVLLVTGGLDTKFTTLAKRVTLRRGGHEIVEGAGHNVMLERPDVVAALLLRSIAS